MSKRRLVRSLVTAMLSTLFITVAACQVPLSSAKTPEAQATEPTAQTTKPVANATDSVERLRPQVVATYPHDPAAFTQGLLITDDVLLESTGLYGRSSLRRVDRDTGDVIQQIDVSPDLFAEGLAQVEDRLIQLTWQAGVAIAYDAETFAVVERFNYDTEGWGLCFDGERLIMSDGSSQLFFRDPTTFAEVGRVDVTLDGNPVTRLNELECVDGSVYANVWQTDQIVVIDPESGQVTADIYAAGLIDRTAFQSTDVLNGIAHDKASGRFYITGKLWPSLFEVRWVPR